MNNKGMYLGKFTYRDGGLVRMENGGPDPTKPYMYLDTKNNINSWMRPPENTDQSTMVDWERYNPSFAMPTATVTAKRSSPEDAAKARAAYLQTAEGQEEERQRLMQEFVDQQNNSKSPLQASLGNLSLDNPATRDAASNYAGYKMGQSSPMWATDRLLTGHDEPTTRDFYRPHESTLSFGIPAAAVMAPIVAEAAVAAAPAYNHALHAVMDKSILRSPLTLGRALKADAAFQIGTNYVPHGIKSVYDYSQTGDTDYLKAAGEDAAMTALNAGSYYGRAAKVIAGAKKPAVIAGYAKDALGIGEDRDNTKGYATDNTVPSGGFKADSESTAVRSALPLPMMMPKKNGGDISVPNLKRVKIKALPKNWKSQ